MDFRTQLSRFVAPISNRIRMMLARAVIKAVNDNTNVQQMMVSLLVGEIRDGVERFSNYGFDACPLPGMEAFVGFIGGDRGNPVVISVADRQFRIKGKQSGEVVIYTDEGDTIFLKRGHNIEVNTETLTMNAKNIILNASEGVQVNTPLTKISENTEIDGMLYVESNISSGAMVQDVVGTMASMRATYNIHVHVESNSPGGSTAAPTQPME